MGEKLNSTDGLRAALGDRKGNIVSARSRPLSGGGHLVMEERRDANSNDHSFHERYSPTIPNYEEKGSREEKLEQGSRCGGMDSTKSGLK